MEKTTYTEQEVVDILRGAIEDRAAWFCLLLKAAREMGYDADAIAEKAITTFGVNVGKTLGKVETPEDFLTALSAGIGGKAFENRMTERGDKIAKMENRYCPLVEAWKKLGCSREEIAKLCELAMFGDYGRIQNFPGLELELTKRIAYGDECCEFVVTKKCNSGCCK